jgi:hypothetical protein
MVRSSLLQTCSHMGVGGIHCQGKGGPNHRVSKQCCLDESPLGGSESGPHALCPQHHLCAPFAALEAVREGPEDVGDGRQELPIKTDEAQES